MKRYIPSILVFLSLIILTVAASMSDGGTGIGAASLVGIAGIIIMVVGVVWSNRIEEAAIEAEQAAIRRSKIIAQRRTEYRKSMREAQTHDTNL